MVGVDDAGEVIGIPDSEDVIRMMEVITSTIFDSCFPNIVPEIYTQNIFNKTIIVIEVSKGGQLPYYLKRKGREEGTYLRIGPTNRLASNEDILDLERQRQNISFDEEADYFVDFESLNLEPLREEFSSVDKELTEEKLKSLKLIIERNKKLYPSKGLLVLLGVYENCQMKCARFKGVDMSVFIDKKEYSGDLFSQLKNAEIFVKNHINIGPQITQLKNKEVPEIPYVAIREALVNAFVHRDYSNLGRYIKIGIYDDIVDIVSPGGFPSTLTQYDVLNGRSEIRNRVIARVFKELGYIEQWGSGVQRMISSCQEYGLEVPTIMEKGASVEVNIYRNRNSAGEVPENTGKNKESAGEVPEKIGKEEQKKLVLKFLETNEKIIRKDVEKILSVGVRRARFILAEMVKEDILIKCGESSNTYYILNQKNNREGSC